MKNQLTSFLFCTLLLFACREKKENRVVLKTTKWENGNIRSEGYFINDSIGEGLFKGYYYNGQLETEINYHNNKKNGQLTKYFESGKKLHVIPYVDGIPTGVGEGYYESGAIKWYQAYDRTGKNRFQIDLLEDGKIKSVKGCPVVDTTFSKKDFKVGDTLKVSFTVAIPKNSKVQFQLYEDLAHKQNGHDLEINEKDGTAKYEKILDKKGIMKWGGEYLIKLDNGEKIGYPHEGELIVTE